MEKMFKIEKKLFDNNFALPEIIPDGDENNLLAELVLTENNINILKYYFDNSDYRWPTKEPISEIKDYKPGNVLYLYEDGIVYFDTLEYCKSILHDETAIEYVVNV